MEKTTVRKATLKDLETLLRFEQGIIAAERPYDVTLRQDPIVYYDLETLILADNAVVAVAEHRGRIVASGHATIKEARHYLDHDRYVNLGFMYTEPYYRGNGINLKIMDFLGKWANDMGYKELRLTVYCENLSAIKAYEKAGFVGHILEMRRR